MKLTLRTKLILLSTLLVTFIMVDVTYFFTIREVRAKRQAVENQMGRIARNIATMQLVDQQNWNDYQNYISRLMAFNDDIIYIAIYDARNWLRAHTVDLELIELDRQKPLSKKSQEKIVLQLDGGQVAAESQDDIRTERVNIQIGDRVLGSVHVGFSLIKINDELQNRILRNVAAGIIFIVIFSILTFFGSRRLTRPLEKLSAAMTALAGGDLQQKVEVDSKDEIGQLAQTFNEMVDGLHERNIIEKLGQEMRGSFQLRHLADLVRNRLSNAIAAEKAKLFLADKQHSGSFSEIISENGRNDTGDVIKFNPTAAAFLSQQEDGFLFESAPESLKKAFVKTDVDANELIIPMMVKNSLFGLLIFFGSRQTEPFSVKQRHFAATLANQASLALENARLYDEVREQDRLKRELEIAREVQQKLLPDTMPEFHGFQFDGICHSAYEVGGDYFDFFKLDEDNLGIVIADVSGKGTSASFYMAEMKGMISSLAMIYRSPKKLLSELNKQFHCSLERNMFATMIYGVLNVKNSEFRFVRAGHNSLIHFNSKRESKMLTPSGIGLGLDDGEIFEKELEESIIKIDEGDTLLLFTDGITEAMNDRKEEFGEKRLLDALQQNGKLTASNLRKQIFNEVEAFVRGATQHDDLTLVIIQS